MSSAISIHFEVGQLVRWTCSRGESRHTREGMIVAVVRGGRNPNWALPVGMRPIRGYTRPRKETSYIVRIGTSKTSHWPVVETMEVI